jgi:hypothetical protein
VPESRPRWRAVSWGKNFIQQLTSNVVEERHGTDHLINRFERARLRRRRSGRCSPLLCPAAISFEGGTESGAQCKSFSITPGNGDAPLRFATRDKRSYLPGALDEIAIFDRKLTADELAALYQAAVEG